MEDRLLIIGAIALAVVIVSVVARYAMRHRHAIKRIATEDLGELPAARAVVVFTSPYCHGCRQWLEQIEERELTLRTIDIGSEPQLATRYKISATPRVAVVETTSGDVLREFDHYTPRQHDLDAISRLLQKA